MSPRDAAIVLEVRPEEEGERLDKLLAQRLSDYARAEINRWIEAERVTIDGVSARKSRRVRSGQRLELRPLPPPVSEAIPEDLPLDIRHEDEHLVVVHKPAGVVVHPAPGHPRGTLVNALLHHVEFVDRGDPMRPGIVHRIDKDTSGLLVVAKSRAAREGLVTLFQAHDIDRRYDALALGRVQGKLLALRQGELTFDTLHGRHPHDRKRFTTQVREGKRAVTHVALVEEFEAGVLWLQCRLDTGRTHQIRVHLSEHGAPLLGDEVYGGRGNAGASSRAQAKAFAARRREARAAIGRQALHAAVLGFVHPISGEKLRFEASPPEDFLAAAAVLRGEAQLA